VSPRASGGCMRGATISVHPGALPDIHARLHPGDVLRLLPQCGWPADRVI
jgi:hypothetical protein